MKTLPLRRTTGVLATAAVLSISLAACGSDDSGDSTAASDTSSSSTPTEEPSSEAPSSDAPSEEAGAASQVFGDACSAVPTSGPGSFDGMVQDPVATAASNNPLLKTLVTAVGEAGLVDTLNGLPAATVFAPTDDAFAKIPAKDLKAVLADKKTLTAILTHHVIGGEQLDPEQIVGQHETVNKDMVTVDGDTSGMTVENGKTPANVLCGNIPTANATVYVIDSVLMPS